MLDYRCGVTGPNMVKVFPEGPDNPPLYVESITYGRVLFSRRAPPTWSA